ncbi:Inner membrane transporter rhtA [Slackia heliotrinireducens]|uniref:Predicted permease, DMT superfamily n=1 Tax=Slackia heliotrinireducens (strain ATCC 29202 / DSM 20476 / NCTC 11029 / RHS 1) TaxID=471855 RepID=C7N361_SLAHD|nr:EamA family transporter [Slackia heliotrinireducens]ACV21582.1 predicted permease, DMT superfamily [Slackia heliotrinireducens DSM 20476]VEG99104.1 Inner membrane transporter rhtA [Slackia heliotrinireducens]
MDRLDKKALVKYLCALLLFGSNGVVASRIAMGSHEIVFLRTLIGSVFLIAVFLLGKGTFHIREYKRDALFIVLSGAAMGLSWLFVFEAYRLIGVGFSTLLYYCGPVIVMILSPVIFRERLTKPKVVGFVIVLVGLVLVNGKLVGTGNVWGLFCGAMSAVMLFLLITFNKQSTHIVGMENSVIQLTASFLTVAVFVWAKQGFALDVPAGSWLWVLMLGLVNTGLGCYLYFSALSKLPVQTVAVCGYLEPLSAVVFSAVLLGERMTPLQVVGAVCIIGGAMIGELVKERAKRP